MSRPDEGMIHQWLDGECTPEESARIEQLVATDPEWAAAVAEARGLIAASSRIVGALDAVPRAIPAETKATSAAQSPVRNTTRRGFRVAPWMGVAAALVLVAGTAYVLREQSTAPFSTSAPTLGDAPRPPAQASGGSTVNGPVAAERPSAPRVAGNAVAENAPSAPPAPMPAPQAVPEPAAPPEAEAERIAERSATRAAADAADARRATLDQAEASRRAPSRAALAAPMAGAAAPAPRAALPTLDGCWRVSAPPALSGIMIAPEIRRSAGDTLVLVTAQGDITVLRVGDVLRGGLDAKQEPCRTP